MTMGLMKVRGRALRVQGPGLPPQPASRARANISGGQRVTWHCFDEELDNTREDTRKHE